jgi:hypothetical protein
VSFIPTRTSAIGAKTADEILISREDDSTRPGAAVSQRFSAGAARADPVAAIDSAKLPGAYPTRPAPLPASTASSNQRIFRFGLRTAIAIE